MQSFTHVGMPGRVVHGAGRIAALTEEVEALDAQRVMFCCTKSRVAEVEKLAATLGDRVAGICDKAKIFVPLSAVVRSLCDSLIADGVAKGSAHIGLDLVPATLQATMWLLWAAYAAGAMGMDVSSLWSSLGVSGVLLALALLASGSDAYMLAPLRPVAPMRAAVTVMGVKEAVNDCLESGCSIDDVEALIGELKSA